ncbi:hypothetical protein [Pleomorphovibrio marinus]|uniref:hypothetical protein n=1 Tax=Pleomorphovibrio marinus TaxID=2164132 RepID=UPI000E0A7796|nr:hypothetical protein [Pleomorphovibrio marinus]
MNQSQKHTIFKVPEGYFNELPEKILRKRKWKTRKAWIGRVAAAAILVIGMVFFLGENSLSTADYSANIEEEMELWISAGYWNEEDMLLLAENPDEILEIMLQEAWDYEDWYEEDLLYHNEIW